MLDHTVPYIILISYIAFIAVLAFRDFHTRGAADFMIAKRDVGWFPTMASIVGNLRDGAGIAAWVVLGIYFGFGALWLTVGLCVGLALIAIISGRLRQIAVQKDYFNVIQLIRDQIGPLTERVSTIIIALTAILYAAAQVHVSGRIFAAIFHWPVFYGILLTVGVVGGYLALGGYATSIRTGIFQWFIVLIIIVLPFFIENNSWSVPLSTFTSPEVKTAIAFMGISFLVTLSSTDLWQLIFSARSKSDSRIGFLSAIPIYLLISIGMVLFAGASHTVVGSEIKPENVFFTLFSTDSVSPAVLGAIGVFVAAAVMSTLDSQVFLFCSTVIGQFSPAAKTTDRATERQLRKLIIFTMILLCVIAATIINLVEFLFSAVTLATILTPALLVVSLPLKQRLSDRGMALALIVTALFYAFLFSRGAFSDLIVTLIPAGIATVLTSLLLAFSYFRVQHKNSNNNA